MQQVSNNHINSEYAPRQKHLNDANGTTIINAGVTPGYHFTYSSSSVSRPTGCTQFPLDVTTTRHGQIHHSAEAHGRRLSSASSSRRSVMVAWTFGGTIKLRTICIFVVSHVYIYICRYIDIYIATIWELPCTRCQNSLLRLFMRFHATGVKQSY